MTQQTRRPDQPELGQRVTHTAHPETVFTYEGYHAQQPNTVCLRPIGAGSAIWATRSGMETI